MGKAQKAIVNITKERVKRSIKKTELFDMDNLDDLPEELRKHVLIPHRHSEKGLGAKIIELFREKPLLSTNEILIGLYRRHNIIKTRTQIATQIAYLTKSKRIVPASEDYRNGIYKKV